MADVNANIGVNIDTTQALAQLKSLQRQISQFHTSIAKSSETAALAQRDLQRNFINSINSLGAFSAELRTVRTTSESFTDSLEKNKFSMREYFRYAGGATKTFGRLFKSEFDTIGKVAEDRVKRLQTQYIKLGRDTSGAMKAIAVIPNELDLNNWSTRTQLAAQRQAIFNQLIRQGSTNLLNFGKNTQWAGRQLMVGFTLPLATLGTTAARTFMEMEAAALKFRKVYGDLFTPREETQQALADITALGQMFTKYGIAVSDTVGLAAEAAAAGFQGVDLQRQTTQATRLSVLGQIEQQKALETTISLQNAFKMSSEDLAGSIDFLNAVENQTVVSLDDITTAIPKVAPVIQQLGGNVKDLAFFMAAMKEGGVNASEGANALKSGLASLINPTDKASALLQTMGINIKQIVEANKGDLKATVIAFAQALDTLDPLTRARAIEQLFGKFQFARLSTLFDNVTNQTGQAARVLDLAGTSIEDLAALSEKELGMTADSAMNKFRKSVEDLKMALVPVGETFLQAVTPIVDFIGGILEKFNNLSSGVKKAIVVLTVAIGAIGPIALMTFGLLANGLANIVKGAMILRNGYLRLTGQTQVLGEQTDYLTVEQMNAAAVAHSLDQSHARLTQTFTAETTAITQLIQAYDAAARAGARFAMTNPGMMNPPRKYNQGVSIVPGSGNRDTVPAMLTPGEAVIPKDMVKQYGPLINGMIAGNIPGYESGLEAQIGASLNKTDFAHITDKVVITLQEFLDSLNALPQAMKTARANLITKLEEIKGAFGGDLPVNVYSGLGFAQRKDLNIGMSRGGAVSAEKFLQDFQEKGIEKWSTTLKIGGAKLENVSEELVQYDQALEAGVQRILDLNKDATITSDQFSLLEREVRNTLPATSALRQALDLAENTITEYRLNLNQQMARSAGLEPYRVPSTTGPGLSNKPRVNLPGGRTIRLGGEHDTSRTLGGMGIMPTNVVNELITETKVAAGTQSPSKRTIPIGEDIARGLQVGMQNQMDETAAVGTNLANAAVSGTQGGRRGPRRATRPQGPPSAPVSEILAFSAISSETKKALEDEIKTRKTMQQRMASMNNALMAGTFALTSLAGAGSFASGTLGNLSQQIFKYSGLLFGLMSVTQLLTQTKVTELVVTRAAVAKQAMAFATYGTGIKASKGLFGSLTRLGIGLTRFLGPVGLVTGALTLAYGAFKVYQNNQEKTRLAIEGLGDAATLTKDQLKTLGDMFGVVPATTPFESTGAKVRTSGVQRQEIERVRASEDFQKTFAKSITSLKQASDEQAQLIFNSLAIELRGKGFAKEQVNTIIQAIQEESGKTAVKFDFANIDIATKEGLDQLKTTVNKLSTDLGKEFSRGYTAATYDGVFIKTREQLSKSLRKSIHTISQSFKGMINGISGQFAAGTINAQQFSDAFGLISKRIEEMPQPQALLIMKNLMKSLPEELQKSAAGIKDVADQMLLLKAQALGVAISAQVIDAMLIKSNPNASGFALRGANLQIEAFRKAINDALKEIQGLNEKAVGTITGGGTGEANALQKRIKAIQDQTKAFKILRKAQIDAKTATELSNDAEIASLIIAGAKNGKLKETIALVNKYREAVSAQTKAEYELADPVEKRLIDLDKELEFINLREKLIDLQAAPKIKAYNDELERQDGLLQNVNDRIKEITKSEIDPIQARIDANNYALQQISIKEDEINEKYNAQISALDKIEQANQNLANLQRQRLSLADALTRGDISAAAQIAQDARAEQAQTAVTGQKETLTVVRDQQLAALGRNAIEKENKTLQLEIARIQREKLLGLEQEKANIESNIEATNRQLKALESSVEKQKESATYAGKTKLEIETSKTLIELSKGPLESYSSLLGNSALSAEQLAKALWEAVRAQQALNDAKKMSFAEVQAGVASGAITAQNITPQQKQTIVTGISNYTKALNQAIDKLKKSVKGKMLGGPVVKYMADGGKAVGSDTVPAMLTPGEFIVNKSAAKTFGPMLNEINESKYPSMLSSGIISPKYNISAPNNSIAIPVNNSAMSVSDNSNTVYNYNVGINVGGTNASPDRIAKAVINEIKYIDLQRIRNQRA